MLLLLFWPFFFGGGGWILFPFNTNVPVGLSVNYMAFGNWFSDAIDLSRILPAYSRIWWDLLGHRLVAGYLTYQEKGTSDSLLLGVHSPFWWRVLEKGRVWPTFDSIMFTEQLLPFYSGRLLGWIFLCDNEDLCSLNVHRKYNLGVVIYVCSLSTGEVCRRVPMAHQSTSLAEWVTSR